MKTFKAFLSKYGYNLSLDQLHIKKFETEGSMYLAPLQSNKFPLLTQLPKPVENN